MGVTKLSVRKRLALSLFRRYKKNDAKIHRLSYILWECTLRCNLQCLHCGSDCKRDSTARDMPSEDFFGALDQLYDIVPNRTMIVLTGGEALLRKDIEQIGIELYRRGFPWGIVTNGMLLSRQKINSGRGPAQ